MEQMNVMSIGVWVLSGGEGVECGCEVNCGCGLLTCKLL